MASRNQRRRPRKWDNLHQSLTEQTAVVVTREGRNRRTFHVVGYSGQALCGISSALWAERIRPDIVAKERQVCTRCVSRARVHPKEEGFPQSAADVVRDVNEALHDLAEA